MISLREPISQNKRKRREPPDSKRSKKDSIKCSKNLKNTKPLGTKIMPRTSRYIMIDKLIYKPLRTLERKSHHSKKVKKNPLSLSLT